MHLAFVRRLFLAKLNAEGASTRPMRGSVAVPTDLAINDVAASVAVRCKRFLALWLSAMVVTRIAPFLSSVAHTWLPIFVLISISSGRTCKCFSVLSELID